MSVGADHSVSHPNGRSLPQLRTANLQIRATTDGKRLQTNRGTDNVEPDIGDDPRHGVCVLSGSDRPDGWLGYRI